MNVQPIGLDVASWFVNSWHRHARATVGHVFSLGLFGPDLSLHGVAVVGRPVARMLDDGCTLEVTRLATDGTRNACSMLYAAACREARARGWSRVITYTRSDETGASVRAAGFTQAGLVKGRQWDTPSRRRIQRPVVDRVRWERAA